MMKTRLSRCISERSPSEIACRYVLTAISRSLLVVGSLEVFRSGVHAVEERVEVRHRAFVGALHRVVQNLLHLSADLVLFLVRELRVLAEPGAVALERVALRPLLEHFLRDVGGVVVDGMPFHPKREALDQRRTAAFARLLDRRLGLAVDGEN